MEIQVNTHVRKAMLFGGFTVGRNYGDTDGGLDYNDPNNLIGNRGVIGYDSTYQIRAGFSYELPAAIAGCAISWSPSMPRLGSSRGANT